MAFFRDDTDYTRRQTGFDRYKQLLSFYAFHWLCLNLLTIAGALPLALGIWFAIATSSVLLLLPLSIAGGMILGPFLAGLVDSIMRGLRDAPGNWFANYKKSWHQNWRGSLLPGGLLGLFIGLYAFMLYLMSVAQVSPTPGTIVMALVSIAALLWLNTLYWPQLVLFSQSPGIRLRNALLFTIRHSLRVLASVLIQLAFLVLVMLFAPLTLIVLPFLLWFPIFLAQLCIYGDLNADLDIEAQFIAIEGDPWRRDAFEESKEPDEEEPLPDNGIRHWEALVRSIEEKKERQK